MLPDPLQNAIDQEIKGIPFETLQKASLELSERYRHPSYSQGFTSPAQRLVYLITRAPATYAATKKVLEEVRRRHPHLTIRSLLDMGAGPGTAMWAAKEVFPEIERVTLLETDGFLVTLGKRLAIASSD